MLRCTLVGLTIAAAITAQSPLTTTFISNNNGAAGGGVYFDLNVTNPAGITITGLDVNVNGNGSVDVLICPVTRIGNQTNLAVWTQVSTGTVSGLPNAVSPVAINPIPLAAGSYGVALRAVGVAHHYTNGTGANQNVATAELALAAGEASNVAFVAPLFTPRVVNCNIHYANGSSGTLGTNTTLGVGCITVADVSSYENFAASAAFDLATTPITLVRSATGYTATPGTTTYVTPSATAQVLALSDDSETSVTLSQAMPVGSSSTTTSLTVCSNGYISPATGNGVGFSPSPSLFLNGPQMWWSLCWHDYNPTIPGSGQVKFEQIGNIAYVTWDGVWNFGGATVADANTMQAQFDVTNGTVHYVYGTTSTLGNGRLVGVSDAGTSADPGSMDISAALPATYPAAVFAVNPLTLAGGTRPVTGTTWTLNVTNVPLTGVIGVDIFGLSDPNIPDLGFLGMPGCPLRSSLDSLGSYLVAGATHSYGLTIPASPALVNVHVFTASAVFQVPPVNAFGAIISNGIDGRIGDF